LPYADNDELTVALVPQAWLRNRRAGVERMKDE
jgi:hypothetical protein